VLSSEKAGEEEEEVEVEEVEEEEEGVEEWEEEGEYCGAFVPTCSRASWRSDIYLSKAQES
jgi:hypothetical protein